MNPTPEQQSILEAATSSSRNIMIVALAGTGKTSTLEMLARKITGTPILFLAFNKRVVEEAKKRLPSWAEPRTMNGIGHSVWGGTVGKRLTLDKDKMHKIVKQLIDKLPQKEQPDAYASFGDTLRWLRYAKRDGYIPPISPPARALCSFDEFCDSHADEPEDKGLVDAALSASITQAFAGNIDFDDQLYMPVCFGGSWPKYPLVMCDEVQDLSPINHVMLEKLVFQRIIAVGDPWQSIYAFRGAVQNGMRDLVEKFDMQELPLSVTFRVPRTGVERARSRVPHYKWSDGAEEGRVEHLEEWGPNSIPDGAAVVCRNNAPLFRLALRLLRAQRSIQLVGMEVGPSLVRLLKKLGPPTMNQEAMQNAIAAWHSAELQKARSEEIVYEKAECLSVLCEGRQTLAEAVSHAEALFARTAGRIQLLSIHKAKGLEWETVFHLDPWRIPSRFAAPGTEEFEQEMNARYVAETRFKRELFLINMEGYNG